MKYIFTVFILCACCLTGNTQEPPPNGMVLLQHKPLYFTFNNTESLLQSQILQNAIELRLNTEGYSLNTYAQIVFNNNLARTYFSDQMSMRLAFRSSSNADIRVTDVPLNSSPSLLVMQPRSSNAVQNHTFIYDLILKPFTTFIKPDTYSFSLLITITPE